MTTMNLFRKSHRGGFPTFLLDSLPLFNIPYVYQFVCSVKRFNINPFHYIFLFFCLFYNMNGVAHTDSENFGRDKNSVCEYSSLKNFAKCEGTSLLAYNAETVIDSGFNKTKLHADIAKLDCLKNDAKNDDNVLRNKDSLRLSIDRFEEIDSVKWYLYIGSENKEISSKENDAGYTFVVTAENIDCQFSRSGRNNNILVQGGSSWDYAVWSSDDSCHFEAEVFIHKDEEAFIYGKPHVM